MNRTLAHRFMTTFLLASTLGLVGCATSPLPPRLDTIDEPRRAAWIVQDREHALATLRGDMTSIRIAAAKKEAELQELRALVTQLRQENVESRQALLDANRTSEAQRTELAILKVERNQSAQSKELQGKSDQQLAVLQETVATLSQDLAQIKETIAISTARAVVHELNANERKGSELTPTRQTTERRDSIPLHYKLTSGHMVPAVRILREDVGVPQQSQVTVQPGDTLSGLARRHKTTVEALQAANGLQGDQLLVGQELTLP